MANDMLNNITDILPKAEAQDAVDNSAVNTAKFVTMSCLLVISMFSGMIPFFLSKKLNWSDPNRDPRNKLISSLLSFGGGALLCTTFIHLLPEIEENIADLKSEDRLPDWDFSLANLLMSIGFFIIYLVEEMVHAYLRRHQRKQAQDAFLRGHSPRGSMRDPDEKTTRTVTTTETVESGHNHNGHSHDHHSHQTHNHHHHSHIPESNGNETLVASIRGLLIVLALSIHELFEGLAVGLEETMGNVYYMFGSVSAHKVVIAFCIGVELMVHRTKTWLVILYIFIYAIVSPLGIGVGIWLSNAGDSHEFAVASVILQSLASGTLLYVIFFEILSKHKDGIIQWFAVVFGFFLMFGLRFIGKSFFVNNLFKF